MVLYQEGGNGLCITTPPPHYRSNSCVSRIVWGRALSRRRHIPFVIIHHRKIVWILLYTATFIVLLQGMNSTMVTILFLSQKNSSQEFPVQEGRPELFRSGRTIVWEIQVSSSVTIEDRRSSLYSSKRWKNNFLDAILFYWLSFVNVFETQWAHSFRRLNWFEITMWRTVWKSSARKFRTYELV